MRLEARQVSISAVEARVHGRRAAQPNRCFLGLPAGGRTAVRQLRRNLSSIDIDRTIVDRIALPQQAVDAAPSPSPVSRFPEGYT